MARFEVRGDKKSVELDEAALQAKLKKFEEGVDGGSPPREIIPRKKKPLGDDPKAKRDYKFITFPFNKYEFDLIEKAADMKMLTKASYVRALVLTDAHQVVGKLDTNNN